MISLIVPVKNEELVLPQLFNKLQAQTVKADEIILVDGGSNDGTIDVIKAAALRCPIKLISVADALPGRGRNLAIQETRGDVIVSTDAGCDFDETFIQEMTRPFLNNASVDVVYGIRVPDCKTLFEKCTVVAMYPTKLWPYVACMAFKKYVWEKVGGYPETLRTAEDYLFISRIDDAKFNIVVNDKAVIYWRPRSTQLAFLKQYYQYAKGKGQIRVDLIFHLRKLLFYSFSAVLVTQGYITHNLIFFGGVLVIFCIWVWLTIRNHYCWFKDIKSQPLTYLLLPYVVVLRDVSAMLGFGVGLLQRVNENDKKN